MSLLWYLCRRSDCTLSEAGAGQGSNVVGTDASVTTTQKVAKMRPTCHREVPTGTQTIARRRRAERDANSHQITAGVSGTGSQQPAGSPPCPPGPPPTRLQSRWEGGRPLTASPKVTS